MLLPIEKPTKNWKVLLTPAESFTAFSDVCSDFESIFSVLIEKSLEASSGLIFSKHKS